MKNAQMFAACLLATAAVIQPALAANSNPQTSSPNTTAQTNADKDFGMLSKDGSDAFRDLHLARLAIFDANPDKAKSEIADAQSALGKARGDESVFIKAESDLKPPTAAKTASTQKSASTPMPAAQPSTASQTPASSEKIAWLPIDGQLSLGENFVATPDKAGALGDANKHLQNGDKKGAIDTLKLAGIDVQMTLAVLPLDKTVTDVNAAADQIAQGKYYEANATLKQTEDRIRFDVVDTSSVPTKTSAATTPAKPAEPMAKTH